MTILELVSELKLQAGKATPGEWHAMFVFGSGDLPANVSAEDETPLVHVQEDCSAQPSHDIRYIALANPANITRLLDHITELESDNKLLRATLTQCCIADPTRKMCPLEKEIHDGLVLKASRGEYID